MLESGPLETAANELSVDVGVDRFAERRHTLHIKKDPASYLAGEGGMVEEIVCRCVYRRP